MNRRNFISSLIAIICAPLAAFTKKDQPLVIPLRLSSVTTVDLSPDHLLRDGWEVAGYSVQRDYKLVLCGGVDVTNRCFALHRQRREAWCYVRDENGRLLKDDRHLPIRELRFGAIETISRKLIGTKFEYDKKTGTVIVERTFANVSPQHAEAIERELADALRADLAAGKGIA